MLERGEVALRQLGVADLGQQVLVGAWEEPDQGAVIERAGLARIAGDLRIDPVEQRSGQNGRDGNSLFEQVAGDDRAGRADVRAEVAELDAVEHAAGFVVIDDHARRDVLEGVPALVWGCESTMTTTVPESMTVSATGVKGMGINWTIARFSARAIIPSTVMITGLPGWLCSTRAFRPSMQARASGSGLTCATTTIRE